MTTSGVIVFILFFGSMFLLSIHLIKKENQRKQQQKEAETKRLEEQQKERRRLEAQNQRKQEEEQKKELDRNRIVSNYTKQGKISCSHFSPTQIRRIDRALFMENGNYIEAYDSRYQVARFRNSKFTGYYVTSPNSCSCPDFRNEHKPCKHMYYLTNWMEKTGAPFTETDYETGFYKLRIYLFGRFTGGKQNGINLIAERNGQVTSNMNDADIAVYGNTNAVKIQSDLTERAIVSYSIRDAMILFTSEIRHPEFEDDSTKEVHNDQ